MKKDELNKRSKQLQEEYVKQHGMVGKVEAKSKKEADKRYKLHKKLTPYFDIYSRRRLMYKIKDYPENVQEYVDQIINEYGYTLQSVIE